MIRGTRKLYYLLKSRQLDIRTYDMRYGLGELHRKTPFMLVGSNNKTPVMIWEVLPTLEYVRDNAIHANVMPMFIDMMMEHPHLPHVAMEPTAKYITAHLNKLYGYASHNNYGNTSALTVQYTYHPLILDNQQTIYQLMEETIW